jgi:predicted RNA-binding protein with PUA-like domain
MRYWLMKSEPSECSIDDLARAPCQTVPWIGVRNHQARNFMRDDMRVGDRALFYHSSCPQPGIAGLVEVSRTAYPDESQFDPSSPYFDARATRETPRWVNVDVKLLRKTRLIGLPEMRQTSVVSDMQTLRRGNRLSITPVSADEWAAVLDLAGAH